MKKINTMKMFAILVTMSVFASNLQNLNALSVGEAINAINNLEHGESVTIVLDSNVGDIAMNKFTSSLRDILSAETAYLKELYGNKDIDLSFLNKVDEDEFNSAKKFLQKHSKKIKLDLSKTKITKIDEKAFAYCYLLTSIILPNSVTKIENRAFSECYFLSNIILQNSLKEIGAFAFVACYSLINITLPNSVERIGLEAFAGCHLLENVNIPNSMNYLDSGTFAGCYSLTNITLPNDITSIYDYAFRGCPLKNVNIPNTVTHIYWSAFYADVIVTYKGKTDTWQNICDEFFDGYFNY